MNDINALLSRTRESPGVGVMGILNVTPDSFYDGGLHPAGAALAAHIRGMIVQGADIIDIGGESSRPGAVRVSADEQIRRVVPALEHAVAAGAVVSIDTTDPTVAEAALVRGARIVNDVSNLGDPALAEVAARHGAAIVLNHSRGAMADMSGFSEWPDDAYGDVVADVAREWEAARGLCLEAGVPADGIWLDPGLGFSKNAQQSLELLRRLRELCSAGRTVVVGPGRKSFIGALDGSPPQDRLGGTIAACLAAARGGAAFLRVHDIAAVRQALTVNYAIAGEVPLGTRKH